MTTVINGTEFPMATTLRVAYEVQNQHNHAPYSEVFSNMDSMTLEDQIGILYASFKVANRDYVMTRNTFTDYYLDNHDLAYVMNELQEVIRGIMGTPKEDVATNTTEPVENQGN